MHTRLHRVLAGGLAALATLLFTTAASSIALTSAAQAHPAGSIKHYLLLVGSSENQIWPDPAQAGRRNQYVALQPWQTDRLQQLKAANPSIKVIAYQNASLFRGGRGNGISASCVNLDEAPPEEWFLHTWGGGRVDSNGWPGNYLADIGDPSYRQRCAENIVATLKRTGFDGAMLDDVNINTDVHHAQSDIREYSTEAAYQDVMRGHLAYVAERLHAAGLLAVPNFGGLGAGPAQHDDIYVDWASLVDGSLMEHFATWAGGGADFVSEWFWARQVEIIRRFEAKGKAVLLSTHGAEGDVQRARYGYATALLAGEGNSAFYEGDHNANNWHEEYDYDIGQPTSAYYDMGNGVRGRNFECGLAFANPTESSQYVAFGDSYSGSGLSNAQDASMDPKTGLILYKPGCTPGAEPPPPEQPPAEDTPSSGASFEAEDMTLPGGASVFSDSTASAGKAVLVLPNATLSKRHSTSGAKRITVTASSEACEGDAHMSVRVDGQEVLSQTVASGSEWKDYSAPVDLTDATHTVEVVYDNDLYRPGVCDRNLRVDKVAFSSVLAACGSSCSRGEGTGTPEEVSVPTDGPSSGGHRTSARRLTLVAKRNGPRRAQLRWTGGPSGVVRYLVRRNGRALAVTRGRTLLDRHLLPGTRYRYTVAAVTASGRVIQVSPAVKLGIGRAGPAARAHSGRRPRKGSRAE